MNSRQKKAVKRLAKSKYGVLIIILLVALYFVTQYFGIGVAEISPDANAEIHFIDVGQGDSTMIITDEVVILVDCGPTSCADELTDYISAYTDKIDCLVFSHAHEDHMGAAGTVIDTFEIGEVLMTGYASDAAFFDRALDSIEKKDVAVTEAVAGKDYVVGDVTLEVLSPAKDYDDHNNNSIVMRATVDGGSVLFTGDAETVAERDILSSYGLSLRANVLKVGHHGSSTSTSEAFLKAVNPEIAVISCETGNSYGHPHRETVKLLQEHNVTTYRTDEQGSVVLELKDGQIKLK